MDKKEKIFVFFVILSIFVAFLFRMGQSGDIVTITSDGKKYASLPLNKNAEISVNGKNIVRIENGKAYVSYADCPDKLCQKQGKIGSEGGSIVCLPNKMTVKTERSD